MYIEEPWCRPVAPASFKLLSPNLPCICKRNTTRNDRRTIDNVMYDSAAFTTNSNFKRTLLRTMTKATVGCHPPLRWNGSKLKAKIYTKIAGWAANPD